MITTKTMTTQENRDLNDEEIKETKEHIRTLEKSLSEREKTKIQELKRLEKHLEFLKNWSKKLAS